MVEVLYRVKVPFEYSGRRYLQGEVWEPAGGKWDEQIMKDEKLVTRETARASAKRKAKGAKVNA